MMVDTHAANAELLIKVREAIAPVRDWYVPEGEEPDLPQVITDAIFDLQNDRRDLLALLATARKVVRLHDRGLLAILSKDSRAIEEMRELVFPDCNACESCHGCPAECGCGDVQVCGNCGRRRE